MLKRPGPKQEAPENRPIADSPRLREIVELVRGRLAEMPIDQHLVSGPERRTGPFSTMAELFSTGRIIDLILALVMVEALIIDLLHRFGRHCPSLAELGPNLIAGFLLLLSVRAAISQTHWSLIALPLAGALLAHFADLVGRWGK